MPTNVKAALITALIAIATLIGVTVTWVQSMPDPVASASPSPSPSVPPSIYSYSAPNRDALSFLPSQSLYASRGEVVSFIFQVSSCVVLPQPANVHADYFLMKNYITTAASFQGARIGTYFDPLMPVNSACPGDQIWTDIIIPTTLSPGNYPVLPNQNLTVWKMTMPAKPSIPIYAELQSYSVMLAHGYPSSTGIAIQGPLTQAYVNAYRAHRIEPIKQSIAGIGTSIDTWASSNASFRQLVINGAIAPPCVFGPTGAPLTSPVQNTAALQYAESLIKSGDLPPGSWGYVEDEWTDVPSITTQLTQYQTYAPDLLRMITHTYSTTIPANTFTTNLDQYSGGTIQWGYVSCMSQGTCVNTSTPGKATGTPMMVIDAPTSHPRAFSWVLGAIGAKAGLYYNFTQMIQTAWTNQYSFGGNGDGNLMYPGVIGRDGLTTDTPIASIRLKQLRQGSFDQEYVKWAKYSGLVTGVKSFPQDNLSYENVRIQLGNQLNAAP